MEQKFSTHRTNRHRMARPTGIMPARASRMRMAAEQNHRPFEVAVMPEIWQQVK